MPFDWVVSSAAPSLAAGGEIVGWLLGAAGDGSSYRVARWVFLRALGLIHLIAFVSLWVQARGLIGRRGILPVGRHLEAVRRRFGRRGYRLFPTLFWLRSDDRALTAACAAGVCLSVLLILGIAPPVVLLLLWAIYLSFVTAGREFMAYQWDALLLEVTFLSVLLAPWQLWPSAGGSAVPAVPGLAIVLLWWTLFHLVFRSGAVKLRSGDPTWRGLTALHYHFYTQPLPTWPAWHMQRLPSGVKKAGVVATLAIEIALPLLIFGPRSARLAACAGIVFFQLLILATGNYNFFNLLTIALAALLLDDGVWTAVLPEVVTSWTIAGTATGTGGATSAASPLQLAVVFGIGIPFLILSGLRLARTFVPGRAMPRLARRALAAIEPFQTLNGYGLFSVMTTTRPEIILEGSQDGHSWWEYEFRYKPGDPGRRPGFVEPHQPRLDWQMWVAALGGMDQSPWFRSFLQRLLEGSPAVLRLLKRRPFGGPPRYVRATLYDYRFATADERDLTGRWWVRRRIGAFTPTFERQVRVSDLEVRSSQ